MKTPKFLIGCSGYYYPQWKNKFYPPKLPPAKWLEYYSSIFNTVELNGTFYRMPRLQDLRRYYQMTPEHFRFSVKLSRYITHIKRLKDVSREVIDFAELIREGLSGKLQHMLFQLPASFTFSDENLDLLIKVTRSMPENVVELRHISWWNDKVSETFTKNNITFCNVDYPGLQLPFIRTTNHSYLRLHGTPELFKSSYEQDQLKAFYAQLPQNCRNYCIYFNNTFYEAAFRNAISFMKIISEKTEDKNQQIVQ